MWLFHPPTPDGKNSFFRPPEPSNGPITKPFELGVLQMILSDPPMSYTSGATRSAHTRWPKLRKVRICPKCVKNAHFLKNHELSLKKA